MKILFVENRYTTFIWEAIAKELQLLGHEIHWIVQNKKFIPEIGIKHYLINKVPRNYQSKEGIIPQSDIDKILRADRGCNYYNLKSDSHIYYIKDQIEKIVSEIQPDFGIGECTLFHELLTMASLKNIQRYYFFPTSSRFPSGRIAFYEYDTLSPFGGDGTVLPEELAIEMANSIGARKTQAFSLINLFSSPPTKMDKIKDKIKILSGYYSGEKYNTPSVLQKFVLQSNSKKRIASWDEKAVTDIRDKKGFNILYPLQMQPESTIDVWANAFNNQSEVVLRLMQNTPDHVNIIVKPNPTSNQEITDEMLKLLNSDRIIAIKHGIKMDAILSEIDLVVTTTGTIGLESIFANQPVITLVENYFNKAKNCLFIDNYSKVDEIVKMVENDSFPKLSDNEKGQYLNYLNETSYVGLVCCTFTQKSVLISENIQNLKLAFLDVIYKLKEQKLIAN